MKKCLYILGLLLVSAGTLLAQERVYVSTDKDVYVAGENMWCSLYCLDDSTGTYSNLSDVAFLQFVSREGVAATHKIALINGRGCGVFQIPFDFGTGNYSIVAYTRKYGGDSKGVFNGKIISVFNTASAKRVKDGVAVGDVEQEKVVWKRKGDVSVELGTAKKGLFPVKVHNGGDGEMQLSVSVYHVDELDNLSGRYNKSSLLERRGDFESAGELDYAGEVVNVKVTAKDGSNCAGKYMYMSAIGNTDDVYVNKVGDDGIASFYTGNIMGRRDLVFEVVGDSKSITNGVTAKDTSMAYNVEFVEKDYKRAVGEIPQLAISRDMDRTLRERGRRMQISRRFESDTLYDMCARKDNSFVGAAQPLVYNLDEYTRFENLEETLREYVKFARVRHINGSVEIKVLWETQGRCLALLDGIPVSDHSVIMGIPQQLVKQIVVYPRRYMLNHFIYDGVVNFITYKGNMAGVHLPKNVSVVEFAGVSWPLAFLGSKAAMEPKYPNFNSTVYWNPVVEVPAGGEFEFNCIMPQYKGKFRVVVEGLQDGKKEVFAVEEFQYQ